VDRFKQPDQKFQTDPELLRFLVGRKPGQVCGSVAGFVAVRAASSNSCQGFYDEGEPQGSAPNRD